jgi:uncharacterized repeat protein (TIGR02543 family)
LYNANGGSNAPGGQTKLHGTNLPLSSTKPTKEGHTFLGWGTSTTDTTVDYVAGETYTNNASIMLYAIWQPYTYEVYFNANGGTGAPSGLTKTYNVALPLPTKIPTRTNYNFLGWNTYASATTPLYQAGDKYTSNNDVTLHAVWELAYTRPRVNSLSVSRCDENGVLSETGTCAKIKFDWETDRDGSVYAVYYKRVEDSEDLGGKQVFLNGNSGSVDTIIIDEAGNKAVFDTEYAYDIMLNVADNNGYTPSSRVLNALFIPIDFTEDLKSITFGEPCEEEEGLLRFAFKNIDLAPKNRLLYNGEAFFGQKQLWSGNSLMNETHSITLPKPISEMKNGIVLVFTRNGEYNLLPYFVPKDVVAIYERTSYCFPLCTSLFDYIGSKTIYISDKKLEGHADNDNTATNTTSGITYHNEAFLLRYVYEV